MGRMNPQDVERLHIFRNSICSDVTFDSVAPALISAGLINRDEFQQILSKDTDAHRMNQVLKILPTKGPKALTKFTTVLKKNYRWLADDIMSAGASTSSGDNSSNDSNPSSDQTDLNLPSTSGTSSCKQRQQYNTNNNKQTSPSSPQKTDTSFPDRTQSPINSEQNLKQCSKHAASNNENVLAAEQLAQKLSTDMMTIVSKNYRVAQHWTTLAHALQLDNQIAPIRMKILVFSEDMNLSVTYLLKEWMSQYPNIANLGNLLIALRDHNFNDVADELETKFAT